MTTTREWVERDQAVVQHPWLDADEARRMVVVRGYGSTVWDSDGREYLDAESCAWLTNVGHGREELAAAAQAQAMALGHFEIDPAYAPAVAIELSERLVARAPSSISQVRFAGSGSEADDDAVRYARLFHNRRGCPERTWFLSLEGCFHGRLYSGAALQGFNSDQGIGPMLPHVRQVASPLPGNRAAFGEADAVDHCLGDLKRVIDELGPENIAALFAEPVMAGPGMVDLPVDFWPRVQALLREHGILLIFDEVVTAFGRCGDWFAANLYGVEPDIITIAKGIASGYAPLAAVLVSDEVARAIEGAAGGSAGAGHGVSCATAIANLDVIEAEGLVERSRRLGAWMREELSSLTALPVVDYVTGVGLMIGVHLTGDKSNGSELEVAPGAIDAALRDEYGVLAMYYHGSINLVPPLVLTDAEAHRLVDAVGKLVRRLQPDGSLAPLDGTT